MAKVKVIVSIDKDVLEAFDKLTENKKSRSRLIEYLMVQYIKSYAKIKEGNK